mmetsp:Transcript_37911/g.33491  ORF Transcript_37911/g.33491 Transcript_37911/m.33491 type:complete len:151 (-) Transcript_37911:35-487(-)
MSVDYDDHDRLTTLFVHKDNIDKEQKIPLSSEQIMKLVSILVNLQINIYQSDSSSQGEGYYDDHSYNITHCGKDIAEEHGLEIKTYKNRLKINNYPLVRFMMDIGIDDAWNIENVKDVKASDIESWYDGYEIRIDTEGNCVWLSSEQQCS